MASGLLALLDDVAALVKVTAATLDDIPAQVAKTSGKVSGIVIDDAAVTPKYVVGLDPSRELSIIFNIAKKSLVNKILFLTPTMLLLGFFLPWLITPILMIGGAYLCFEGYEKIHSMLVPHEVKNTVSVDDITPEELEKIRTASAIRTDFILSAEIMAITFATVADKEFLGQIMVMFSVAVLITIAVYGFVGLIVKMDDIGLHFAKDKYNSFIRKCGRGLVTVMPKLLMILSYIGTAAMLWVGADIIAHGIPPIYHGLMVVQDSLSFVPILGWFVKATISAMGGVIIGFCIAMIMPFVIKLKEKFV